MKKNHIYANFTKEYFKDMNYRNKWMDKQSEIILNKRVSPMIKSLNKLPEETEKLRQLIGYYTKYQKRMQYLFLKKKDSLLNQASLN